MPDSRSYTSLVSKSHRRRHVALTARILCFSLLFFPLTFLICSLLVYLNPTQSMRICLPFSLTRISTSAHQALSCQNTQNATDSVRNMAAHGQTGFVGEGESFGRLAGFLQSQKDSFLSDLKGGNLKGWTLALGNEAGDLDSLASSIAFSCLSSSLLANRSIPVALTPSHLMSLRPENILALKIANVPLSTLVHPDILPTSTMELSALGAEFALVDHNKLLPGFAGGTVNAVIDHHDDEGLYEDAGARLIQVPTGSCASLVTKYFMSQWQASLSSPAGSRGSPVPPEVATLLLSAILIDTAGLSEGGKATPTDHESAAFLQPISSFAYDQTTASLLSTSSQPILEQIAQQLISTKMDVSHLSTHDLLLRDYKEYVLPTSSASYPSLRVGLSTVPQSMKVSLGKEPTGWTSYLQGVDDYMSERSLDLEGILTTYKTEHKGKHKREIVLIARSGGSIPDMTSARNVLETLSSGLETISELALDVWDRKGFKRFVGSRDILESENRVGKVWDQGNAKATRKQVAPLLRDLIARLQ